MLFTPHGRIGDGGRRVAHVKQHDPELPNELYRPAFPCSIRGGCGRRNTTRHAVTPPPEEVKFSTILDFPAPHLRAYRRETVAAEKFQAMVMLGIANSRMRDFCDIWFLSHRFEFRGMALSQTIKSTFNRRRTALPTQTPLALTPEFSASLDKQAQVMLGAPSQKQD